MRKAVLISFLFFTCLFAQSYTFESKDNRVSIIELYTSQGCSSCPPADEWLSNLTKHPKLFSEFIPMSFHITYWDFIGWKDVFAKKLNDSRQRYYATNVWNNKSVYTPQFVIDAKEYRRWFTNQSFPSLKKKYGGDLKINLEDNLLKTSYFNKEIENRKIYLNVAILGFDYVIDVNAGENKYKTLKHDFVVLEHIQKFAQIKNNKLELETTIFNMKENDKKQALVVWLSDYNSNILQSTGGYIKN